MLKIIIYKSFQCNLATYFILFLNGFREKVDALRKMFGQMGAVAGEQVIPSFNMFPSKLS